MSIRHETLSVTGPQLHRRPPPTCRQLPCPCAHGRRPGELLLLAPPALFLRASTAGRELLGTCTNAADRELLDASSRHQGAGMYKGTTAPPEDSEQIVCVGFFRAGEGRRALGGPGMLRARQSEFQTGRLKFGVQFRPMYSFRCMFSFLLIIADQ